MASEYSWLVTGRVIKAQLREVVGLDDLRTGNQLISRMLDESPSPPVHVIFDCTDVQSISLSALQVVGSLRYLKHPSLGWLVAVGFNGALRGIAQFIASIVTRATGAHIHFCDTQQEAFIFLEEVDKTLPNLSLDSKS
jgi:hypothetical protein